MDLRIKAGWTIRDLKTSLTFDHTEYSGDNKFAHLSISDKENVTARDLHLSFSVMKQPQLTVMTSPTHSGEIATMVSYIPDGKASEMTPGEYIFVIDRSGSMQEVVGSVS